MPTAEIENPVIYYDPVTKKSYTPYTLLRARLPDNIKRRLHTRIMSWHDTKKLIEEIPTYYKVPEDMYISIQETYDALGERGTDRLFEILESYPQLMGMKQIESLDWSPVSKDMYHTNHTYIDPKERNKLLAQAKKAFTATHKGKIRDVIPELYLYYHKRTRSKKRHPVTYKRRIHFKKFNTVSVRSAVADTLDQVREVIDYYYVIAERPSVVEKGMEYRTIISRTDAE